MASRAKACDCCGREFVAYAPNAKYCPRCRPSQGEPLKRDLCGCGQTWCTKTRVRLIGATYYCEMTAAMLRSP
jgi:uncharacterized UBP type Zn finger protein